MKETLNLIIKKHSDLFGINPIIEKINIGFTNTIYSINNYILKICTNTNNEENFKREIDFYNLNKNSEYIPKLYYYNINKNEINYFYEILEKIEGVSLYNVWHTFSEEKREHIIKKLCDIMKIIHSNTKEAYNWLEYNNKKFIELYNRAKIINIFKKDELNLINYAYSKFNKYLYSKKFVLVHNDLHFDNIFYNNDQIKIIDFERSMYAPLDFELDIFYRMVRLPWKFASEEAEKYVEAQDYSSIKLYVEKYYNELVNIKYLTERLAIYDLIYFLDQLIKNKDLKELKDQVIKAAKIVAFKDELKFENLKSPEQLMDYMNINIQYGWLDNNKNKHINNLKNFRENYKISTINEIIETGLGTCIEQAKLIKQFFDNKNIENKLYCYRRYENKEDFDKEVRMHCFVIYNLKDKWYQFEHFNYNRRGIHEYSSLNDALKETIGDEDKEDIRELSEIPQIPEGLTYKEFNEYVNNFKSININ